MPRATGTVAEILGKYQEHIGSFELEMGADGDFEFFNDGELFYSKRETGEFPSAATLMGAVDGAVNETPA